MLEEDPVAMPAVRPEGFPGLSELICVLFCFVFNKGAGTKLGRRHSMENMELMKLTPEKVGSLSFHIPGTVK